MTKFSNFTHSDELCAMLAAIVDSSDDAIISKTLDGIITSWNKSAENIFGYHEQEAVGKHINLIIPRENQDEEFIIIGKVKSGQRVDHFETMRRAKDGRIVDVSLTVSPMWDESGKIIGAVKVARDITQLKDAETARAYLAAIVDSSDDAIISKNLNGVITSWNKSAERMFGYSAAEAVGQHIKLIIPEEMRDEEYGILAKIKSGERVDHFETRRRAKDGSMVEISLTVSPIRDMQGKIVGASKVARDVTQQKAIEHELRESSLRKDEFLANMSHELRTPLNAVVGLAHLLSRSTSLSSRETEYVGTLKKSADSLLTLINDLLDFSRLETGNVEFESIDFSLPETVEKTLSILEVERKKKNLPLRVTYGAGLAKYYKGDPLRIQQVLTNLLGNAVKFTDKGFIELKICSISKDAEQTVLEIKVIDTGIGIAADKIGTIFNKFTQADAATTRKYGGSGLGLSISKAFIDSMGGSISVESREGLGSTLTVTLPLKNSERLGLIDPRRVHDGDVRKSVLIVDDYAPNLLIVTALLDSLGFTYDSAENGLEALRRFQDVRYDLVLMDIQMHGMDGFESARMMREYEAGHHLPRTPIIAMTAHVQERDKHKCTEAGMDDFIPKPFDPLVFEKKVKSFVARADSANTDAV